MHYTQAMPKTDDAEVQRWIDEKLAAIDEKRRILKTLQDNLEQWEQEIDWSQVPPEKQAALIALAEESVTTLQALIGRLRATSTRALRD